MLNHLVIFVLILYPRMGWSITFEEAFNRALQKNETVLIQEQLVNQALEKKTQAIALVLPSLQAGYLYQKQQGFSGADANSAFASIFPTDQTTFKLTATQPVFRGFREYAGIRQANRQFESADWLKHQAKLKLYSDVAVSFNNSLSLEKEIALYKEEISVNQQRLEEIKTFRSSGRYRETDEVAVESTIYSLRAQMAVSEGQLTTAREQLWQLSGVETSERLDAQEDAVRLEAAEKYLERLEFRPDLKSALADLESSDESVAIARGGHLPTIDLTGNYYFNRPQAPLQNITWDVQLAVAMPLYSGGGVQSQYRSAVSDRKSKEIQVEKIKKQAEQEIRSFYKTVQADLDQVSFGRPRGAALEV